MMNASTGLPTRGKSSLLGWRAGLVALCLSGIVFLFTALVLVQASLPGVVALIVAAGAVSLTAAAFVLVWPAMGWRAGLWASAAFLAYFMLAAMAYLVAGRPDWHPWFAACIVAVAACSTAAFVAWWRTRSRSQATRGSAR